MMHFHGHLRDRFHFTIIVFLLAICRFHNVKLSHIIKTGLCITLFHQQMFPRSRQNLLHIRAAIIFTNLRIPLENQIIFKSICIIRKRSISGTFSVL